MMKKLSIFFLFILYAAIVSAQDSDRDFQFDHLTASEGLSHNRINAIYEDRLGFIWIGTLNGLNRFDGYEVKTYYHEPENPNSITSNAIVNISQGPNQTLWINTGEGISIYDPAEDRFTDAVHYARQIGVESSEIQGILVDRKENIWFIIEDHGAIKINAKSGEIEDLNTSDTASVKIASDHISDIVEGFDNNIWIVHQSGIIEIINPENQKTESSIKLPGSIVGTSTWLTLFIDNEKSLWIYSSEEPFGLLNYNSETDDYKLYDERQIGSNVVRGVTQDKQGLIWVGTDHGGISIINKQNDEIRSITNDPNDNKSLGNNNVNDLTIDSRGIIWVGMAKNGVSYLHPGVSSFEHYKYERKDLSYNDMSSLVEDEKGNFYIGTNGRGLLYFDRDQKKFTQVPLGNDDQEIIVNLLYDSNNILWIGTYLEGLKRYENGTVTTFKNAPEGLSENSAWEVFEDSRGNIWIGTLKSGVDKYDPETGVFTNYDQDDGINSNYIPCIKEDKNGNIWLGTGYGLTVYDPDKNSFRNLLSTDSVENPISNNSVTALKVDSQNRLWVGTMGGLNLYQPENNGFRYFFEKDGLSSNIIMGIEEDENGNIWVSTSKGITKLSFHDDKTQFKTFDISDGLQGDSFNEEASLKTSDGLIAFAGQNGFNLFNPNDVQVNTTPPTLNFTDLYISNKLVKPHEEINGKAVLTKSLNFTRDLDLKYNQNSFTIEFAALTYFQPGKNKYQYKLEGFDEEWINVSPEIRRANYTNLDFGDYVLKVRAANNHNVWNEGIKLNISISPPFWKTPLAYVLYFLFISSILLLTRSYIVEKERLKARIATEKIEAQRLHELDMMKIKFFTNISHEFKTPLSLILTPIERIIKNTDDNKKLGEFELIKRNAKRLLTLVNQLLDFRKMEANQHVLSQSNGDLVAFLKDTIDSFSDLAQERNIEVTFESTESEYNTRFDKDKMEKIMFNLISNALKFTKPGGSVTVNLNKDNGKIEDDNIILTVSDTGIGIPENKLPLIFNRFMQSDIPENMVNNGTGIGLSITREFVELHNGKISVESQLNIGTTFTLILPLQDLSRYPQKTDQSVPETTSSFSPLLKTNQYTVFLVEDNSDFRFYLKDNLKQHFNIGEAENGKKAWKAILASPPDVVISDVMMPEMNGLELTQKIKNDPRTAHIPVILLTAQSSDMHKIEGLESGAIEYISKPFNFEILKSSINAALKLRKNIEDAGKKIEVSPEEIAISSMDEKLIQKALKMIEDNMSNTEFTVETMSRELGYSRGHFYKKIVEITGKTPLDFVRDIKMKRAAELLKKSQLNVSEVAYMVGYNNPKLFSKYFKAKYNQYPSQFIKDHLQQS